MKKRLALNLLLYLKRLGGVARLRFVVSNLLG